MAEFWGNDWGNPWPRRRCLQRADGLAQAAKLIRVVPQVKTKKDQSTTGSCQAAYRVPKDS